MGYARTLRRDLRNIYSAAVQAHQQPNPPDPNSIPEYDAFTVPLQNYTNKTGFWLAIVGADLGLPTTLGDLKLPLIIVGDAQNTPIDSINVIPYFSAGGQTYEAPVLTYLPHVMLVPPGGTIQIAAGIASSSKGMNLVKCASLKLALLIRLS